MKLKDNFHIWAILTILFGSLAYVLTRFLTSHFSIFSLGFLRYFIATIGIFTLAFFIKLSKPKKHDIPWFLLSGLLGFFLYIILFNKGQSMLNSSTGSLVMATTPVITALLASFVYREKLAKIEWFGIFIQFFGVYILSKMNGGLSFNSGVFWLLLTAIILSFYNLVQRKLTKNYPAFTVSSYSIFVGTIFLSIFSKNAYLELQSASLMHFISLFVLGVFSSAIACATWARAFSLAKKTTYVTNYMFITPFLTTLLGYFLISEVPNVGTIIGGFIILFGMLIFNFKRIF